MALYPKDSTSRAARLERKIFAECVAVLLQTRAGRRAGVSGWCTYRESAPVRLTAPIPSLGCQGASVWRALARQLASFHARKHGYAPGWLAARRRKRSRLAADVLSFSHAALLQRLGAHVEAQRSGP